MNHAKSAYFWQSDPLDPFDVPAVCKRANVGQTRRLCLLQNEDDFEIFRGVRIKVFLLLVTY